LSPDGSAVVFGAGREIDVMNVDRTGPRFVGARHVPDWSTDGSTIAFARPDLPPSQRGGGDPFVWQFWSILPMARASRNFMAGRTAASVRGRQDPYGRLTVHRSREWLNRLRIIDADGHGARTIRGVTILSGTIAWRPSA
jgi:hypothetical protein